jgi:hypothetical protein
VQVEHRRLFLYSLCWSADSKKRVQLELEMLHYACLSFSIHPAGLFSYAHEYNSDIVFDENLLKLFSVSNILLATRAYWISQWRNNICLQVLDPALPLRFMI